MLLFCSKIKKEMLIQLDLIHLFLKYRDLIKKGNNIIYSKNIKLVFIISRTAISIITKHY